MISLSAVYLLIGLLLLTVAVLVFRDSTNPKRIRSASFWAIYGLIFLIGDYLPAALVGVLVIVLALVAGSGGLGRGRVEPLSSSETDNSDGNGDVTSQHTREQLSAAITRIGHKIFLPALCIPAVTLFSVLALAKIGGEDWQLLDAKNITLVSLAIAVVVALVVALWLTRAPFSQPVRETKRLLEAMGWAVLLPQLLATLGFLFNDAGVGTAVASLTRDYLSLDSRFAAVAAYAIAMALFTIIMGNAFAAFPVITAGLGVPLLIIHFGGNPAVVAAIGMFCGYCGTLLTPMAANFNLVPAALLELKDQHAVIKAQAPTALILLIVNIFLLDFLAF